MNINEQNYFASNIQQRNAQNSLCSIITQATLGEICKAQSTQLARNFRNTNNFPHKITRLVVLACLWKVPCFKPTTSPRDWRSLFRFSSWVASYLDNKQVTNALSSFIDDNSRLEKKSKKSPSATSLAWSRALFIDVLILHVELSCEENLLQRSWNCVLAVYFAPCRFHPESLAMQGRTWCCYTVSFAQFGFLCWMLKAK